jgi:sacsin
MMFLIHEFKNEAKKLLLFLNHVKKIGLWEINKKSELKPTYSVSSHLDRKHEQKLHELHRHLQQHKNLATGEIPMNNTTYTMCVEDEHLKEKWLIHQNSGIKTKAVTDEEIPNVRDLGLFPRAGVAALLPSNGVCNEEYVAYCFLPLPVITHLPVHVNGHFALDGSRRDLWDDTKEKCWQKRWNQFMKAQVLGPAYATLITKAKEYLHCKEHLDQIYFSSKEDATEALWWYHELFPNPDADPKWEVLVEAVYQCLKETAVFPVVSESRCIFVPEEDKQELCKPSKYCHHEPKYQESARELHSEHVKMARSGSVTGRRGTPTNYYIEWLPPNSVYFTEEKEREELQQLLATLLRIRMPVLLYTPSKIHVALLKSDVESHLLAPQNVVEFLLTSQDETCRCDIGKLPVPLNSSSIQNKSNLQSILIYCEAVLKEFPQNLEGLPLLLTDDNTLRVFTAKKPVYCSSFSKLFPTKSFKFVHSYFVEQLSTFCEVEPDIIRGLSIPALDSELMPDIFRGKLALGERKHVPWEYPKNGTLSKEWFAQLWKFLKTAEKSDSCESLQTYLGKYPIIPTTDGKLATISNAKSVLAMTDDKKGSYLEQEVIRILGSLNCPFLDESITRYALSVVIPLVADPRCVSDVLDVLHYMNSTGIFNMKKFGEEKIDTLLRFFQGDWQNNNSMNVAKTLPFYKGVDGDYHSLSSYHLCIQVPAGLPNDGIKELQRLVNNILFLPNAAISLNELYKALGINMDCGIFQFYITYVLPRFSSFSRECQIKFLTNIIALPYMTEEVIEALQYTGCIPDQNGNLRVASSYFNPHDELFKVMFKSNPNVFPAAPFNGEQWIHFLTKIGLKENCDEQQFIRFAKGVEESAQSMSEYDENIVIESKALVKYLVKISRNWCYDSISEMSSLLFTPNIMSTESWNFFRITSQCRGKRETWFGPLLNFYQSGLILNVFLAFYRVSHRSHQFNPW